MGDAFQKVLPGQRLNLPAEAYNSFLDAARTNKFSRNTNSAGRPNFELKNVRTVKVRNDTGGALTRFSIVALGDPFITPTDNLTEWQRKPNFAGSTPSISTPAGRWGVLVEPLADGEIGEAAVSGVVPVKLSVPTTLGTYAKTLAGDSAKLDTDSSGDALILWSEGSGTERWAVVRLGDASGSGGGGGSITLEELDGSPSNSVSTVKIDQGNGLGITGTDTIYAKTADFSTLGMWSTGAQNLAGDKSWRNTVNGNYHITHTTPTSSSQSTGIRHYEPSGSETRYEVLCDHGTANAGSLWSVISTATLSVGELSNTQLARGNVYFSIEDATGTVNGATGTSGGGDTVVGGIITALGGGSSGTVTSVGMTVPSDLSVSGSPITTSGTLAVTRDSQNQNLVLASPDGSSGVPSYRALTMDDLPTMPSARVYHSSTQAISTSTFTNPSFDSETWDDDSYHDTSTNNNRLTVSETGRYIVGATIHFDSPSGATTFEGYLEKNGTTAFDNIKTYDSVDVSFNLIGIIDMVANDYVNVNVWHNQGSNLNILAGSAFCSFWIQRLPD